ncbi:Os01g0850050, partial [Oryza sativa Japonica Group]
LCLPPLPPPLPLYQCRLCLHYLVPVLHPQIGLATESRCGRRPPGPLAAMKWGAGFYHISEETHRLAGEL